MAWVPPELEQAKPSKEAPAAPAPSSGWVPPELSAPKEGAVTNAPAWVPPELTAPSTPSPAPVSMEQSNAPTITFTPTPPAPAQPDTTARETGSVAPASAPLPDKQSPATGSVAPAPAAPSQWAPPELSAQASQLPAPNSQLPAPVPWAPPELSDPVSQLPAPNSQLPAPNSQLPDPSSQPSAPSITDYLSRAIDRGLAQQEAVSAVEQQDAPRIASLQQRIEQSAPSPAYQKFSNPENSWGDSVSSFIENPLLITTELVAEGLSSFLPQATQTIPTRMAQGIALGVPVGAAIGAPVGGVGAIPGAVQGGMTGARAGFIEGMGETSYALNYSGKILESLAKSGVDLKSPDSLTKAFSTPEVMASAKSYATRYAVPAAAFDSFAAGIGGRLFRLPAKSIMGKAAQGAGEVATQTGLAMAGQATGELASSGTITPANITAAAVGNLGPGIANIGAGAAFELGTRRITGGANGVEGRGSSVEGQNAQAAAVEGRGSRVEGQQAAPAANSQLPDSNSQSAPSSQLPAPNSQSAPSPEVRGLARSIAAAENVAPEIKTEVADSPRSLYEVQTDAAAVTRAKAEVDAVGIDAALTRILGELASGQQVTKDTITTGFELAGRLQGLGRFEDGSALLLALGEKLTTSGQATQAASLLTRMSPQGIEIHAQTIIRKVAAGDPRLAAALAEIQDLRQQLLEARQQSGTEAVLGANVKPGTRSVDGKPQSLQAFLEESLLSNPKNLWAKYKTSIAKSLLSEMVAKDPNTKAALDLFSGRLLSRMKQQLPENLKKKAASPSGLSPEEAIGELLRNQEKYREAWRDAREYAREQLKDNPDELTRLSEYLDQVIPPESRSPIEAYSPKMLRDAMKSIRESLNLDMRSILVGSEGDKQKARLQIASLLIERAGLTNGDAEVAAAAISREFTAAMSRERDKMLRVRRDAARPELKTKFQKLVELNNAGALSDTAATEGVAKILGAPIWTRANSLKAQSLIADYQKAKSLGMEEVAMVKAAEVSDLVHESVTPSVWTKSRAAANMAMLLNTLTIIKNVGGNLILWAPERVADAVTAYVADPLVSRVTGSERTVNSVEMAERIKGLAQPVVDVMQGYSFARQKGLSPKSSMAEGVKTLVTLGRLTAQNKFEIGQINAATGQSVFSSPVMRLLENTLSVALSGADRAFYSSQFKGSIAQQLSAAKSRGESHVGPTSEMLERASMEAARAIYQDPNFLSTGMAKVREAMNWMTTLGKSKEFGLGMAIAPFAQVPGSILLRGVEWSPIGFLNAAWEGLGPVLTSKEFDQKKFSEAFTRATLGTAGLSGTGAWLAGLGIVTAMREDGDDLEKLRRSSGFGSYRINATALKRLLMSGNLWTPQPPLDGDVIVSYDWAQPLALPLAMGAQWVHERDKTRLERLKGKPAVFAGNVAATLAGSVKTLESQPMLSGLVRFMGAAGNQGLGPALADSAASVPGMYVPTAIKQVNKLMDNYVREARAGGPIVQNLNQIESQIPWLAQRFPIRYDAFGQAMERYSYGGNSFLNVMLNPAFVSQFKSSPALREMESVFSYTGNPKVVPNQLRPKLTLRGQQLDLTNEQLSAYQQDVGSLIFTGYTRLAMSPKFAGGPADAKASAMIAVSNAAAEIGKLRLLARNRDLVSTWRDQAVSARDARQAGPVSPTAPAPPVATQVVAPR
jgi:hypothetical protein